MYIGVQVTRYSYQIDYVIKYQLDALIIIYS